MRFLSRVCVTVTFQMAGLCESLVADSTFMRFLSRVGVTMYFQTAGMCESLVTDSTLVRFLPGVHTLVFPEITVCGKSLAAHSTFMRSLSSVHVIVSPGDQTTFTLAIPSLGNVGDFQTFCYWSTGSINVLGYLIRFLSSMFSVYMSPETGFRRTMFLADGALKCLVL